MKERERNAGNEGVRDAGKEIKERKKEGNKERRKERKKEGWWCRRRPEVAGGRQPKPKQSWGASLVKNGDLEF